MNLHWWIHINKLILMILPLQVDIYKSPPMSQYWQINMSSLYHQIYIGWYWWNSLDELISMNPHQSFDISESTSNHWYWCIYTDGLILMNLPWQFDINESTLRRRVDIDEYIQKSRYPKTYPKGFISMNLHWQVHTDTSILMTVPL